KHLAIEVCGYFKLLRGLCAEYNNSLTIEERKTISEDSTVSTLDKNAVKQMMASIDLAKKDINSIGIQAEVIIEGMPAGIGSYVHYERKLDSKIAGSVVSINAFKGVEFGIGFQAAKMNGSDVHDEIVWNEEDGYHRSTNRLGGFEGGMTTGMPIVVK